ncbi:MAG: 2Fe-2S ferredoxin [Sphingomonas sp.]|nr:MAG: 2Fe-2S ferredoxin [Sphingomonas sp.]
MTHVRFLTAGGALAAEADAAPGSGLLDLAQSLGLPLEGTCEGAMACSTCHVILPPELFRALPPPSDHEEDMLDFTAHVTATSRLACQVMIPAEPAEISIHLPPGHQDMRGR